jgi:triacylglycerol lipase
VHGWSGFANKLGVDYFYGILSALRKNGVNVYAVEVSPVNSSEYRGEQLYSQVQAILSLTGAKKVNLVGHSHGAMTSRYVASNWPKKVASVISVGGVNWGAKAFDFALNNSNGFIIWALDQATSIAYSTNISNINTQAAYTSLSTAGSIAFNKKHPEGIPTKWCGKDGQKKVNGVRYYSWTGHSAYTNFWDPVDYPLHLVDKYIYKPAGQQSDGLVPVCGSHLGEVLKSYNMNHLDEINQSFGIVSPYETSPINVYLDNMKMLKNAGL